MTSATKILGLGALFSASIGVIVSQVTIVAMLQGFGLGGVGFLMAMGLAFLLAMANAMAYTELALMMPEVTSLSSYSEAAIGNFPAILVVFAGYVVPAMFGAAGELILMNQVLEQTLPFKTSVFFWPVILVTVFATLNILGTDVFARVQTALSFTVLAFLIVTGVVALSGIGSTPLPPGPGAGWPALSMNTMTVGVVALAFWGFVGSEYVTSLVAEAKNPRRDLPLAVLGGLVLVFIAYATFGIGSAFFVTRQRLAEGSAPHLEFAVGAYGPGARVWFSVLAILASASLLNTVLAAVPRMLLGMANNGQVFPIFRQVSARYQTPVNAIVFVACMPLVGLAWSRGDASSILPLSIAASITWLMSYMLAQVSLIVLRVRYPDWNRPFRVPMFPLIPAAAIVAMAYVCVNAAPTPEMAPRIAEYTGVVLGLFTIIGALWVRFVMKKGLFEPVTPVEETRHAA